ncbi:MAG: phosphoribosylpyrophosphate synthetase [Pelagibacteraceae bacterium]|nr:phosphoribosylpyrophosphate synthetase [Pelagibacteraceae bacterium]|tara:strand:- start:2675 stop:3601 length:927 start_codon:yes stop_codon:yes gene_type:complete
MKLISGNSNKDLSVEIAKYLKVGLTEASITKFSDKEIFVEIHENVRGEDVFILQSTSFPANDNLMELLVTIDALRRGSASRITAVIPYFGYARQDRKTGPRTPISAKLVANLITTAGANRVLTMDLHAGQIQGFFDIPLDNLYAQPLFTKDIIDQKRSENLVFVSPDVGGVMRARSFAKKLDAELAIIDKRRDAPGVSAAMNVIGNVKDKKCIIIDDLVDSGGTICNAALALKEKGAHSVYGYCSHGVYSGKALENIQGSVLEEMVCTNSIKPIFQVPKNMRFLSVSSLFGEAIMRINNETSISSLFD